MGCCDSKQPRISECRNPLCEVESFVDSGDERGRPLMLALLALVSSRSGLAAYSFPIGSSSSIGLHRPFYGLQHQQ